MVSIWNLKFRQKLFGFVLLLALLYVSYYIRQRLGFDSTSIYVGPINGTPQVEVIGINQKRPRIRLNKPNARYIFVLTRKVDLKEPSGVGIGEGVGHLVQIMNSFHEFDGATCFGFTKNESKNKKITKSCWFENKNWTIVVNSSGRTRKPVFHRKRNVSVCNIVEIPFIIRRKVLDRIGLRPSYGEATLLDFFLRSKGTLKIAASHECTFNEYQLKKDRGALVNNKTYMEYGQLGYDHNILRIVREDSITWTACSLKNSCLDEPEQQDRVENILLPYCCKTRLGQILENIVNAFNQLGIDYRVCFGTLLGAIRTKTIIPWTPDIDICIKTSDYVKKENFDKIQKILEIKHHSCPNVLGLRRVLAMRPLVKQILNASVKQNLFNQNTLQMMREMLPIREPTWNRYGYADIYEYDKIFNTKNTSKVSIDGVEYLTSDDPHERLFEWFGKNYMSTDEKDRVTSDNIGSSNPHARLKKKLILCFIILLSILISSFLIKKFYFTDNCNFK